MLSKKTDERFYKPIRIEENGERRRESRILTEVEKEKIKDIWSDEG